jgi:hypothetical protein
MKPEVMIYNWSIVSSANPYTAPEAASICLAGDALDRPNHVCFSDVRTSRIINLDLKGRRVETLNTIYLLEGPPDQEWAAYLESIQYDLSKLPE